MTSLTLTQIRQTAAEILAAAVLEISPDAHIIEGRATFSGFAYDFLFPKPFSKELLPYIEERMYKIIEEDLPIEYHEMIPDNAAEFFRSYPRYYPSVYAKQHPGPLVEVFKMRGFADLCPGPYARSTGEIGAIKLIAHSKRPNIRYRGIEKPVIGIHGVVCENKQKLKEFLKNKKQFFQTEHREYGAMISLFRIRMERGKDLHELHRCYWLKNGERLKEALYHYWKESHESGAFEVVQTQGNDLLKNHEELLEVLGKNLKKGPWKVAEYSRVVSAEGIDAWRGLFDSKDYYFDRAHIFCLKEHLIQELISSLQFLEKTIKMFGFEGALEVFIPKKDKELCESLKEACDQAGVEYEEKPGKLAVALWRVTDRYGMRRSASFIELKKREKGFTITHSIFDRVERFIALMMEAEGPSFEDRMKGIAKKTKFE